MPLKWRKLGRVLPPDPGVPWMSRKAGPTFAEQIGEHTLRLYVTGRDSDNISRIGNVDLDSRDFSVKSIQSEPLFDVGDVGTFDESGVSYPWIVDRAGCRYLFYAGWIAGTKAGFKNATGLAISQSGGPFQRYSRAPVLPLTRDEPFDTGSVAVLIDEGIWKMYYTGFSRREPKKERTKSYYHIRYARSLDGLTWERPGTVCIDFRDEMEFSIGKPMILKECGRYKMWYSYSDGFYKIGYAESSDGMRWQRLDDQLGLLPSAEGWDSEMVEYPFVIDLPGGRHLFYNGNGFGESGLGVAVLEEAAS